MKTIAINGSNGFLGKQICNYFENKYHVIKINREDYLISPEKLALKIKNSDIIINLAGAPISLFSTNSYRKSMYDSRISTTSNLVRAIEFLDKVPDLFISMSAVGIYDNVNTHDENSLNFGNDFLSNLCVDWEKASNSMKLTNNKVNIRTGIILSQDAGFFNKVYRPFKFGLGVVLGNGKQSIPFIHIYDFLRGIEFVIDRHLIGIVNFVAPNFCSNLEFSKTLSRQLKRPLLFKLPAFIIRLVMGKQSSMLLEGQRVKPGILENSGFEFSYPDIESTVTNLLNIQRA